MSASTVSITANATTTRRKHAIAAEKKQSMELSHVDASAPQINGLDDGNSSGKHHVHPIRDESLLEKSKDVMLIKKSVATSTILPRRSRKSLTKPEKPKWKTVISVITKNIVLLLVIAGCVHMMRKMASNPPDIAMDTLLGFSDFETRIAELESFLKKATKLMQVQVEVVDQKVEKEVGELKYDIIKKIEERDLVFVKELRKLDDSNERLGKDVDELRGMGLLTKDDLDQFIELLKKRKGEEEGDRNLSLDDVRVIAKNIIEEEMVKHAADGLGMVDYALASSGAMVINHSDAFTLKKRSMFWLRSQRPVHEDAVKMLSPSFGEPGQCFPLKGSSGFVEIRLRTAIVPEAVTLEHVAKGAAFDRSSAPRGCRIMGRDVSQKMFILLSEFAYDLEKTSAQTFKVLDSAPVVNTVRLDFDSNHGSPSHTCIYRLRVHGHEPHSVSVIPTHP